MFKKHKLVLIDLDNTLIDSDYKLSVPINDFRACAESLENVGVSIGLCSDSAVVTLQQWKNKLGIKGPVVAERGAVIWDPQGNNELILQPMETKWFSEFRREFILNIMSRVPKAGIYIGDATRFAKSAAIDTPESYIFAINGYRKASFSFFALRVNENRRVYEPDPNLLAVAISIIEEMLPNYKRKKEDLFWDENLKYGILIVHENTSKKQLGISRLMGELLPSQTVMIGDSISDYLDIPGALQFAVGNADFDYKRKCDYVATEKLTAGVIECLNRII